MIHLRKRYKSFAGWTEFYEHRSEKTASQMRFSIFRPASGGPFPVLYWLSGLTCTEENFMEKSGIQRIASQAGLVVVAPDTSPRACGISQEDASWEFGSGASFYVDATCQPWSQHYQMYSYVVDELPTIINENFTVDRCRQSISGHSMGGHGALTIGLRNHEKYCSISAFSPIASPSSCAWGMNAFRRYLGSDKKAWKTYDTCELLSQSNERPPILVDQGSEDEFLRDGQLQFSKLENLIANRKIPASLNLRSGYDHSYYFVATFLENHIEFHRKHLFKR